MLETPQTFSEFKPKPHDNDFLADTCVPLGSYQQTSPYYAARETSRDSLIVADELKVRRLRCVVLGLGVEDNALTLSEHEDNGRAISFSNDFSVCNMSSQHHSCIF